MASVTFSEIATQSATLRAELKEWEREFAAANGGRKAGRGDIKNVPGIAAKYKEYSKLKALETSSTNDKQPGANLVDEEDRSKKRKRTLPSGPGSSQFPTTTSTSSPRKPSRGSNAFETPSKARHSHPSNVDPYDSPSALRRLFSPTTHIHSSSPLKSAIGPTPQRDGKALGLFDLLSESGGSTATPSATRIASLKGMAAQTPTKRRKKAMDTILEEEEEEGEEDEESPQAARTPASSGKKYMLSNLFATPTAWRYSAMAESENTTFANPETTLVPNNHNDNDESATPSFLKRSTSGRYAPSNQTTGTAGLSPIAVRKPPQFVGKGLSALVQNLRDMEEDRLDDDLDVLREIEAEQASLNVEVLDSQMPGNDYIPRKKKGQKRTTRLVRMKPVITAKAKPNTEREKHGAEASDESEDELVAVAETQQPTAAGKSMAEGEFEDDDVSIHTMSEPDLDSDDPDYDADSKPTVRSKSFSEKMKEAIGTAKPQRKDVVEKVSRSREKEREKEKEKENKKPAARKVNPQAHANYRSLKIRNRGSKGRGGGRFGRRR